MVVVCSIAEQAAGSTGKCFRARITMAWPSLPLKLHAGDVHAVV
jgi:hypothetical protein